MKCKEYVEITPQDPNNQQLVYLFEKKHMGHNSLITRDIKDIKNEYTRIEKVL